jgi:soluble lytic murein transglycosylase-like protein
MCRIFAFLFIVNIVFGRTTLEQIRHNKPSIELTYARSIASLIDQAADRYKVPANVLAAIAMQESSYILGAINKHSNDYGMFQINKFNIKAYNLDKNKLLTDLAYSVDKGAFIFSWFYKRYELERAVRSYNGGTSKGVMKWKSTEYYWKRVKKFM